MLPVPAKRSKAVTPSLKSMRLESTLKRFSLAKSVVGRALKLRGTSNGFDIDICRVFFDNDML